MDDAPRSTAPEPADPAAAPDPAEPGAVPVTAVRDTTEGDEMWRQILTGEDPHLPQMRRLWRRVPSSPRCKLCGAPFGGLGKVAGESQAGADLRVTMCWKSGSRAM